MLYVYNHRKLVAILEGSLLAWQQAGEWLRSGQATVIYDGTSESANVYTLDLASGMIVCQ